MDPEDVLQLRGLDLSLCKAIYTMVVNMKANKCFCQQLGERVNSLEELVLGISRGQSSSTVHKALKKLCETLDDAQILMMKFFNTSAVKGFFMSSRLKEHFQNMDKRLTDDFHILSGALLIQQGNLLHKVYNTVRGQRQHPARPRIPARPARAHTPIPACVPHSTPPVSCMGPPCQCIHLCLRSLMMSSCPQCQYKTSCPWWIYPDYSLHLFCLHSCNNVPHGF